MLSSDRRFIDAALAMGKWFFVALILPPVWQDEDENFKRQIVSIFFGAAHLAIAASRRRDLPLLFDSSGCPAPSEAGGKRVGMASP